MPDFIKNLITPLIVLTRIILIPDLVYIPPEVPQIAPQAIEIVEVIDIPREKLECHCVPYARKLGLNLPRGDAKDLMPNSPPVIGGGILIDNNHVGVILGLFNKGVWIGEGWLSKDNECITRERIVYYNSSEVRGFVNY